jgi:hypothetical protein
LPGKHEQTNKSFSFYFSHDNDSDNNQLDSSKESLFFEIPYDTQGELHNPSSSSSPFALMQDVFLFAAAWSQ